MASKLTRFTQAVFGSGAGANQVAEFGSLASGTPLTYSGATITPAIVQTLSNYLTGWFGAVVGSNSPAIEDMNALHYLFSYQLSYLLQQGIGEWDASTSYFTNSMVQSGGVVYLSLQDNNLNKPVTNGLFWGSPSFNGSVSPAAIAGTQSLAANSTTSWPNLTVPSTFVVTVPSTAFLLSATSISIGTSATLTVNGTCRIF